MRWALSVAAAVAVGLLSASCSGDLTGAPGGTGSATPAPSSPRATPTSASSGSPSASTGTPPPIVPASGTGAYGYVTAGPTCPVERPDHPCPPRPVSDRLTVRDSSGATVASARSDPSGRYAVDLPPGTYLLVVGTGSGWPHCSPATVTVRSDAATRTDISCDTGIR